MATKRKNDDRLIRFDWAMKRLLRDKANFNVLEGFLTSLLGEEIFIVELLESEGNVDREDGKLNRVDLLAKDHRGRKILIEVQNQSEDEFFHRILFGTSKIINDYINRGDNYGKIDKIYSISLVYFNIANNTDYIYRGTTEFRGIHNGDPIRMTENWKFKYQAQTISDIYPEYYILLTGDFDRWSKTPIDQWMYFLSKGVVHDDSDAPGLDAAREKMRVDRLPENEREAYYRHLESINSAHNMIETAKDEGRFEGRAEGRAEGLAEGRAEGLAEGRAEGLAEGRAEGLAEGLRQGCLAVAREMLAKGLDRALVLAITRLTDDEISRL
ncbi:MAG: Rpn family recombination-promoting nuclease/putative transposase [Clostridium sp.]|nr:Rpn family recombination-promoting nuclease/putative transposase [Clostridium sp.]